MDLNAKPNYDVPLWSETRWNGCWNPDEGVGLYIHAGRMRGNIDMWYVQSVAYLPGGQLAVDRSWSRSPHKNGVRSEHFDLTMTETGWSSSFDGVGQITTIEELSRAPRGCSTPMTPMRWEVTNTPASPVWDMFASKTTDHNYDFAADLHIQQGFRSAGILTVGGRQYRLDGVGFKDHSCGVRDWSRWHSHRFVQAVMPAYTLHAAVVLTPDGAQSSPFGALFRDGEQMGLERFELPPLADPCGGPLDQQMIVKTVGGEVMTLRAELVHALPMIMTVEQNDNVNGIDWDAGGDPIVFIEGIARLTQPDGAVGYAFLERSAHRSALKRPL